MTADLSAQSISVLPLHDDRLNELRLLKLKLGESRRELHILKNSVANIDILKHEVHCLGRELLQERTKVKALSEELENPLNVHRYDSMGISVCHGHIVSSLFSGTHWIAFSAY